MTILEQARSLNEEIEVLERTMFQELGDPASLGLHAAALARKAARSRRGGN